MTKHTNSFRLLSLLSMAPKLVILATGEHSAGKDFCAEHWGSAFGQNGYTVRVVSISDDTKNQYALATAGVDIDKLLTNPHYKEEHRPALTAFWQKQKKEQPLLPEKCFRRVVESAADDDVLIITGMGDEAPVAAFSPLIDESRMLDVRIEKSEEMR